LTLNERERYDMIAPASRISSASARLSGEGAFEVLARSRELEAQGRDIVHLQIGEPDFDTPAHIKAAGIAAIERNLTHYSPSAGLPALRDAVASYAARFRGVAPYSRDDVAISPGCKPLVWNIVSTVLNPGDEMIYADPSYSAYAACATYLGSVPVPIPLLEATGFRLDLERLASAITPRTKLIVLNSPHNPTGGVLTRADLETIAELAIRHDLLVLSDEIYSRNIYEGTFASIASIAGMRERTIVVDGFSKAYAMTGWRLGYAVMPQSVAKAVILMANNNYSCTATFVQYAGIAALEGPDEPIVEMVEKFRARRDRIVAGLNSIDGISCRTPDGAFYVFPNVGAITTDDKRLASFLLETAGVAGLGGSSFGPMGRGHLRFSYANSIDKIDLAIERIRETLPSFS
jgi:aspartate aminotransferase